ncbi:MAG TPA: aldehyde dehydrogenase family protein [Bacteroidia bacterium]|nr:aldehyde dehydrogenase family protein [Bacteroidia bacterium]
MQENISAVFKAQQQNKFELRKTSAAVRIEKLKVLKRAIESFETEIYQALQTDLRKSKFETAITELFFTYAEIDYAIKRLKGWMSPKTVGRTMSNFFAVNKIYYEPKGVCLIIAPWNYPFQLIMSPLISAIAAGNCAILKPSEISEATGNLICKIISKTFNTNEIACFEGGVVVSKALLELPFDHIFFTGSTAVGKTVMAAAAKNLTSVTLELGGKSPVIVDATANLKNAAEKIAWGKLVNVGQTCIAPDYVLIDKKVESQFVAFYKEAVLKMFFNSNNEINRESYGRIISEKQFKRLTDLIKDAVAFGADLVWGGESYEKELTVLPTILKNVTGQNPIMQQEIFGPILPIITFEKLEVAIDYINAKDKPLALYVFSNDTKNQERILTTTSAGGTCVNDVLVHIGNPNLPFGGVNSSGIGSCHGLFGFKNFSHERAVVFQSKFGVTKMIYPPYEKKGGLLKWLKKVF